MGTHMKTTIEIADALLRDAKAVCKRENTTLRALVEAGLRQVLGERSRKRRKFELADARVRGRGLSPELQGASWAQVRDLIYGDRG